ncbi:MAG: nitroreductase family protein [Dehalococcoidia bacterium]|nr:nitroreductase family protein [Dehalococcoidia bacterium]
MKDRAIGDLEPVVLPQPAFGQSTTVFEALKMRRTSRSFKDTKISLQILSDILWAAQGINRIKGPFGGPGRTAASASNSQEICVYVAMEEGTYLYEPESHRLTPVIAGDIRSLAIGPGQEEAGANAPLRLIYVVDIDKFKTAGYQEPGLYDPEIQKSYHFVDTGLIAQNVYLASSSLGLASWFHNCNKAAVVRNLQLQPHQRPLFGQTVGYADD